MIAAMLIEPHLDETGLRYLLSSLAAFKGYPDLAAAIEGLDISPLE